MKQIDISLDLPLNPYSIHINHSWQGLASTLKPFVENKKVMIVLDETVNHLFYHEVYSILVSCGCQVYSSLIEPGEASKSLKVAETLYTRALEAKLNRSSAILALGGGVVGDLAGFVASTFMRGISFIQIPTTLLAQVDSSVGGKVAVNHPLAKNIIGSFYQPKSVYINLGTLMTLPERQYSTGMAELIKYGFIWDIELLEWLQDNIAHLMDRQTHALAYAVQRCCETKAHIVSKDEKEHGLRAILNFGHTIGHGLESMTGYSLYTHGEAIALGMIYESRIAQYMGLIDASLVDLLTLLLEKANLPTKLQGIDVDQLIEAMTHDKKNKSGSIVFILPIDTGKVDIFDNVDVDIIYRAFKN
ncbi:MAG TPA: 3-dehydroquinate synthase [Clostridia bacterium]|nr:3-dehydroquinate synthase [Clostridia bacterium]